MNDDKDFQFRIDVPRITLYVDGAGPIDTSDPPRVWDLLVTHFGAVGAQKCSYYMTQTCLAPHYIAECKFLGTEEYLLSTNLHEVYVNTVNKTMMVKKRFRLTRMIETSHTMYDLDTCTLTLIYLADGDRELEPRWEYVVKEYYKEYHESELNDFVLV